MGGFENCTSPNPTAVRTTGVWDVAEWLKGSMNLICNHSYPHVFKIEKKKDGQTTFFYKKLSTDKTWMETKEKLLLTNPLGSPQLLEPSYQKLELEKLKSSVEKSFSYFKREEDKKWWQEFFGELNDGKPTTGSTIDIEWPLAQMLAQRRVQEINSEVEQEDDEVDFSDEDDPIPPVIIGKKEATKEKTKTTFSLGEMVLLKKEEYKNEWPQVAQILEVQKQEVKVHWFKGSKTSNWKPCTVPVRGKRGKREPWIETLDISNVIFGSFNLTNGGKLPKTAKDFIDLFDIQVDTSITEGR